MKDKIILGIAVLALILSGIAMSGGGTVVDVDKITKEIVEKMGSVVGPTLLSPFWTVNNVETRYFSSGLSQASTTVCMFKTPTATSTLVKSSVKIVGATSTVLSVEIGKSANQSATTTRLAYVSTLAASSQLTLNTFVASTTAAFDANADGYTSAQYTANPRDIVFAPNTWWVAKIGGGNGSLNVLTGSCKAEFRVN